MAVRPADGFRAADVARVFQWIRDGEPGSIIGLSNVGKSFLFHFLMDPKVQASSLKADAGPYYLLRLNMHNLSSFATRGVYSLILEQLELLGDQGLTRERVDEIMQDHKDLLDAGQDELKIQYYFRQAVKTCLDTPGSILVLLFDHFDQLYKRAGEQLFYNLRGMRDAYKTRISYLVFTRSPLPRISLAVPMPAGAADDRAGEARRDQYLYYRSGEHAREEFYELMQTNQLYLRPYEPGDAAVMLESLSQQHHLPLDGDLAIRLIELTGGHAGLLRMCYLHLVRNGGAGLPYGSLADILEEELVAEECEKIWLSLTEDERIALAARLDEVDVKYIDKSTWPQLKRKGLVSGEDCVFSPLFELFVRHQKTRLNRPIYINENKHAVYVYGNKIERLTNKEYVILKALYDRGGTIVSSEELLHIGWPEDVPQLMHGPDSLNQEIYRIRQHLAKYTEEDLLQTVTRAGYLLKTESDEAEHKPAHGKPAGRKPVGSKPAGQRPAR